MNKNDMDFLMACHDNIVVDASHLTRPFHYLVATDTTRMARLVIKSLPPRGSSPSPTMVSVDANEPAIMEGKPGSFFDGIKIGGEFIRRKDSERHLLFNAAGKELAYYSDIGVMPLGEKKIVKISVISVEADVTTKEGLPLNSRIFILPAGAQARLATLQGHTPFGTAYRM